MLFLLPLSSSCFAQEPTPVTPPPDTTTAQEKPLPSVPDLLDAVEKHEDDDDKILQQYTYRQHEVVEDFDGKSAVKKTTTYDFDIIPVNGVSVRKLVAKDGKPLTPDEAQKAQDEFDKSTRRRAKDQARQQEKKEQAEREGKSNKDFLTASRILQLGTFSNEHRVLLNGRPTIVLDYAGNREVKSANETEKIVEDLVGTCWIDEQDKVIARAEGRFPADFKIGFGLVADIHQNTTFVYEQQKINGEVWLPKHFEGTGKLSIGVFIVRINGHLNSDFSDYRKFRASATIVGSNGIVDENGKPIPTPPEPDATKPGPPKQP